jgi:hypothetical protein
MGKMQALGIFLMSLANVAGAANDLQYDPRAQQRVAMFNQIVDQTAECMHGAARNMLMQGARDSAQIHRFQVSVCGPFLFSQMTQRLQRPEDEARELIELIAERELGRVSGVSRLQR